MNCLPLVNRIQRESDFPYMSPESVTHLEGLVGPDCRECDNPLIVPFSRCESEMAGKLERTIARQLEWVRLFLGVLDER